MQRILVTGAAGFIGSHLSERLLAAGHAVTGLDNFDPFYDRRTKEENLTGCSRSSAFQFHETDLRDVASLGQVPGEHDVVVHLAAKAGVLPSVADPAGYVENNVNGTQNLLEWMRTRGIRKYLFGSSSSVYGNNVKVPFSEADPVDHPISPYAFTKKTGELLNHAYHHLHGIDTVNLRFFTVYGPRQRPDLAIHKFTRLIDGGEVIDRYGDGTTARDYTYVEDTLAGILSALRFVTENDGVFETFNLGNNRPVPLHRLLDLLFEKLGAEPRVNELPMQPGDVNVTFADIEKAGRVLGYAPQVSIEDGLDRFIAWFRARPGT